MGQPAAKANDQVVGDRHPHRDGAGRPGAGADAAAASVQRHDQRRHVGSVKIGGQPAAVVGSTADNTPAHIPTPPGVSFQKPPANKATIQMGSASGEDRRQSRPRATATRRRPATTRPTRRSGSVVAAGTVFDRRIERARRNVAKPNTMLGADLALDALLRRGQQRPARRRRFLGQPRSAGRPRRTRRPAPHRRRARPAASSRAATNLGAGAHAAPAHAAGRARRRSAIPNTAADWSS